MKTASLTTEELGLDIAACEEICRKQGYVLSLGQTAHDSQ